MIDSVVQPGNEPQGAKWLDLLMLALFAGRERDEGQWRALLRETGWEPVALGGRPDKGAMPLTVGTAGHIDPTSRGTRPAASSPRPGMSAYMPLSYARWACTGLARDPALPCVYSMRMRVTAG